MPRLLDVAGSAAYLLKYSLRPFIGSSQSGSSQVAALSALRVAFPGPPAAAAAAADAGAVCWLGPTGPSSSSLLLSPSLLLPPSLPSPSLLLLASSSELRQIPKPTVCKANRTAVPLYHRVRGPVTLS